MPTRNTLPPLELGTPETVPFDVKISSPHLAFSSARRFYLRCRRKANRLIFRGQDISRQSSPVFEAVHRQSALRFGYAPHSLDAVLKS